MLIAIIFKYVGLAGSAKRFIISSTFRDSITLGGFMQQIWTPERELKGIYGDKIKVIRYLSYVEAQRLGRDELDRDDMENLAIGGNTDKRPAELELAVARAYHEHFGDFIGTKLAVYSAEREPICLPSDSVADSVLNYFVRIADPGEMIRSFDRYRRLIEAVPELNGASAIRIIPFDTSGMVTSRTLREFRMSEIELLGE